MRYTWSMTIGVRRSFGIGARDLAAASQSALDVPLADEAELWIARPSEDAIALGAFQRSSGASGHLVVRRGSGGPAVRMGEGTLWVALLLPRVDALVACDEPASSTATSARCCARSRTAGRSRISSAATG